MPTTDQVINAFEFMKFEAFGTTINLTHGKGHQASTETAYGLFKFDKSTGTATITDIMKFRAECVNPPLGTKAVPWIKGGMKGAKCG